MKKAKTGKKFQTNPRATPTPQRHQLLASQHREHLDDELPTTKLTKRKEEKRDGLTERGKDKAHEESKLNKEKTDHEDREYEVELSNQQQKKRFKYIQLWCTHATFTNILCLFQFLRVSGVTN